MEIPTVMRGAALPLALAASALLGCTRPANPTALPVVPPPGATQVAEVAGQPIFADAVKAQMARTHVDARTALDQLITFEVLARAAAEAGAQEGESAVERDQLRATEVQRLIERDLEPRLAKSAITEAEVRVLYDRARSRFVHGRLVQVAVLCVFTGARLKPEPRARAEANARALKRFVDTQSDRTVAALEAIAKAPEWVERNVSFTTVWQGADDPFPPVVGNAVAALDRPGDTTDLVGDETGYYIARYIAEKAPENVAFAEAAPRLRTEMFEPWRRQRFLQLTMELSNGHDIEVFRDAIGLLGAEAH